MKKLKLRPEVLAFSQLMERELRSNDRKGGWHDCTPEWLLERLRQETRELAKAMAGKTGPSLKGIASEAADVANFAMMIVDVCEGLSDDVAS